MLAEVLQVVRGAGKVGAAFVTTQGEQLRLMACNTSLGAGMKAAQTAVTDVLSTVMGGGQVGVSGALLHAHTQTLATYLSA